MHDTSDTGPPHTDLTLTQVEVDLNRLTDFRTLLERELDTNLKPVAAGIQSDHGMGVVFGGRIPGNVQAVRQRYAEALTASNHNLGVYIRTSEMLISAIRELTTTYADTDLSAKEIVDAINKAIATAPPTAPLPDSSGNLPASVANLGLNQ